jgi:hypothetical protein
LFVFLLVRTARKPEEDRENPRAARCPTEDRPFGAPHEAFRRLPFTTSGAAEDARGDYRIEAEPEALGDRRHSVSARYLVAVGGTWLAC